MLALMLTALALVAPQGTTAGDAEREIEQLVAPDFSADQISRLTRFRALRVVEGADLIPRMQSFEGRHDASPRELKTWPAAAARLGALLDALNCPPTWLPDVDPMGRETLVTRATLFAALGCDEQADADLDRLATLGAPSTQLAEAQLGFLRAARAERQGDARTAWDERVIAATSAWSVSRVDLRDAALVQLALMSENEHSLEDRRALLSSAASPAGLGGPGFSSRSPEPGTDTVLFAPPWLREWASRELARLDASGPREPDRLDCLDVYSVVALCIRPRDAAEAPRLLAVVHFDAAAHPSVLRVGRDDLATVAEWLKPEFRRIPTNWDDAVDLLALLPDPGRGPADLVAGMQLLAPGSIEGVGDVDHALRRWLRGGPDIGKPPVLTAGRFLAAWKPWLAECGLVSR